MNNKLTKFNLKQRGDGKYADLRSGDIVRVHRKIKEGEKERVQVFEGMIIAIKGKQSSSPMITVRKVSNGVGVELILPVYSPSIGKIDLVKRAKVRRSKLYYIRNKTAKSLRFKFKDLDKSIGTENVKSVEDDNRDKDAQAGNNEKIEKKKESKTINEKSSKKEQKPEDKKSETDKK